MCDSVRLHRRQPTRLRHPWDSPGKNTGVGCHFLLQWVTVKNASEVTQSCLTLRDPMDCSLKGSSVHGIFQARVLEWGAIAFSDVAIRHDKHWLGSTRYKMVEDSISSEPWASLHISMLNNTPTNAMIVLTAKLLVTQLCPTLCDPMDCSLPGSSVHEILQARILEWAAIPFCRGSSQPRDRTWVSSTAGRKATKEAQPNHRRPKSGQWLNSGNPCPFPEVVGIIW